MTGPRRASVLLVAVAALAAAAGAALGVGGAQERFPHEEHAGLFPFCTGCHQGIPEGDPATAFPEPSFCAGCHDGEREERVDWTGPAPRVDNLRFEHPEHAAELASGGERELDCAVCHSSTEGPRMEVSRPRAERCLDCHAHEAERHYVDAECSTCHVPLAETRLALARVAALPAPGTHDEPGFLAGGHGDLAARDPVRCATCHVREQCASCHVDAPRVASLASVPAAAGALELPPFRPRYPVPPSHAGPDFLDEHGDGASLETCSTCHTRESCTTCHAGPAPPAVAALPARADVSAPGVTTEMRAPASHASAFFASEHGIFASASSESCATCHAGASFCQSCHEPLARGGWGGRARPGDVPAPRVSLAVAAGDTTPTVRAPAAAPATDRPSRAPAPVGFHPPNYVSGHAGEAYGRRLECSNCHDARTFCRDCHQEVGLGSEGRLAPGFHDAQPVWLLRHGQAARQTLESCASCHEQRDCLQCHSELGAFRVNPHGPGFDARRAAARNAQVCGACHLGDPLRRTP